MKQQTRAAFAVDLPMSAADQVDVPAGWALRIAMPELATLGWGTDAPFGLRAVAELEVTRPESPEPVFVKRYEAESTTRMTMGDWGLEGGKPLRATLEGLSAMLATQMLADLQQSAALPVSSGLGRPVP